MSATVQCADCGRAVKLNPDVDWSDTGPTVVACDDCCFARFGDMLTPRELRRAELRDPHHRRKRDEWLAEYEAAGIAEDQDPGLFMVSVPVRSDGTLDLAGVFETVEDAVRLRFSTPGDFGEQLEADE